MLFNSYEFIFLFVPIAYWGYFALNRRKYVIAAKVWLLVASLFFYSWWNIVYLPLLVVSVLVNFMLSNTMYRANSQGKKKALLIAGIAFNIGMLGYFKYMDFFISNINLIADTHYNLLHLALPLAISFFSLQQITFLVDSYEGLVKERKFLDYAIFVTFFPQLIAGPIVHHEEMMPQFASLRHKIRQYRHVAAGIFIFAIGLFKKVVIADTFAVWATGGFDHADQLNMIAAWATSLSYTFQLYFDFSGYADMAIGTALLFNIRLPINFNSPFKATSIIEFWHRWHITLSNFLSTYLYTPIVKSFKTLTFHKAMLATVITMAIAGIWHGPSWLFVTFGLMHGLALALNHYWRQLGIRLYSWVGWLLTFNFINLASVPFRARTVEDMFKVYSGMFGGDIVLPLALEQKFAVLSNYGVVFGELFGALAGSRETLYSIIAAVVAVLVLPNSSQLLQRFKSNIITLLFTLVLLVYSLILLNKPSEFLYFNF
jgi:alginate O-acetyltransferase complex protein AlgI